MARTSARRRQGTRKSRKSRSRSRSQHRRRGARKSRSQHNRRRNRSVKRGGSVLGALGGVGAFLLGSAAGASGHYLYDTRDALRAATENNPAATAPPYEEAKPFATSTDAPKDDFYALPAAEEQMYGPENRPDYKPDEYFPVADINPKNGLPPITEPQPPNFALVQAPVNAIVNDNPNQLEKAAGDVANAVGKMTEEELREKRMKEDAELDRMIEDMGKVGGGHRRKKTRKSRKRASRRKRTNK